MKINNLKNSLKLTLRKRNLLYESPGGNQVDGLPPVLHNRVFSILPRELGRGKMLMIKVALEEHSSTLQRSFMIKLSSRHRKHIIVWSYDNC